MNAYKLPKTTEEDIIARDQAIQESMAHAAHVPLKVARKALEVMQNAFEAASLGNTNAISDAGSGLFFAKAGLQSACLNVRTNVINITDSNLREELLSEIKEIESQANLLEEKLWEVLKDRGGLPIA
jgi:formiminotetrahydrofolate cyclodeaminase